MTMNVLQSRSQIVDARKALKKKGVSSVDDSLLQQLLRRLKLQQGVQLGDNVKSWDVLETINFIEKHIRKNEPVLDIGCYASEIIVALHKLGYANLTGADLNQDLKRMPYNESIHYEICNFMHTNFADASFKAITSISVIEHGFDGPTLLREVSRLLIPGGYFIASFDYWPEKIDTNGIKFFDMDWLIFSKQDVSDFIDLASDYGLIPVGKMNYIAHEAPIECGGKNYTFGWLVLEKKG